MPVSCGDAYSPVLGPRGRASLADKLRKAIDKFTELLTDISRSLTGVTSFSIGVSATGLSIAANFSTPQPGGMGYGLGASAVHQLPTTSGGSYNPDA